MNHKPEHLKFGLSQETIILMIDENYICHIDTFTSFEFFRLRIS